MLMLTTATASAATKTVSVQFPSFKPAKITIIPGGTITWKNLDASTPHTATSNVPGVWAQVAINPGATTSPLTFTQAGTFLYHCSIHTQMHGKIAVKMSISPASGTTATTFTLKLGTTGAPSGFTHDIQVSHNGGAFASLPSTTSATTTFKASASGTYRFRTRLHPTSGGSPAAWSPQLTLNVN